MREGMILVLDEDYFYKEVPIEDDGNEGYFKSRHSKPSTIESDATIDNAMYGLVLEIANAHYDI